MGSPPPLTSKKDVFRFRSVKSMVSPPANTGREMRSRNPVMRTDQGNMGIVSEFALGFIFTIVAMKFIAPRMEEAPAV